MKRKVIQLAGKTHVISLPSKWIKNFCVKKGDELNLEEFGNHLIIKPAETETEFRKISLKIDGLRELSLKYIISALNKVGYDEITIYFESSKFHPTIEHLVKNHLTGFVVTEQTQKKMILRSIANEIESEFNTALRRTFLVTMSLAESTLEIIKSEKFSDLNSMKSLEHSSNQLTSFCLRLMNKGLYKEQDKKIFLATVIWNMEKIADEYNAICINLINNKNSITEELINLYKNVNDFLGAYYSLMFNFSVEKLNSMVDRRNNLLKEFEKASPKTKEEIILTNRLSTIVSKIADMSSSTVALNHEELNFEPI